MIFNFETKQSHAALAALVVYSVYRSRDMKRFKVSPEMWGQIERFVKSSAKRAKTLPEFIDKLMPRLACASISQKWMKIGMANGMVALADGSFMQFPVSDDSREFLTQILESVDSKAAVKSLYTETTFIILLVRDRIEREKPIEKSFIGGEE
jgi:hypothetical protein